MILTRQYTLIFKMIQIIHIEKLNMINIPLTTKLNTSNLARTAEAGLVCMSTNSPAFSYFVCIDRSYPVPCEKGACVFHEGFLLMEEVIWATEVFECLPSCAVHIHWYAVPFRTAGGTWRVTLLLVLVSARKNIFVDNSVEGRYSKRWDKKLQNIFILILFTVQITHFLSLSFSDDSSIASSYLYVML